MIGLGTQRKSFEVAVAKAADGKRQRIGFIRQFRTAITGRYVPDGTGSVEGSPAAPLEHHSPPFIVGFSLAGPCLFHLNDNSEASKTN